MFIVDTHGEFRLCIVKNGKMKERMVINKEEAANLIREHGLTTRLCAFSGCFTYRDKRSTKLIEGLMANN